MVPVLLLCVLDQSLQLLYPLRRQPANDHILHRLNHLPFLASLSPVNMHTHMLTVNCCQQWSECWNANEQEVDSLWRLSCLQELRVLWCTMLWNSEEKKRVCVISVLLIPQKITKHWKTWNVWCFYAAFLSFLLPSTFILCESSLLQNLLKN